MSDTAEDKEETDFSLNWVAEDHKTIVEDFLVKESLKISNAKIFLDSLFSGSFGGSRLKFCKCEVDNQKHAAIQLTDTISAKGIESELIWLEKFGLKRQESSSANFAHLLGLFKRSDGSVFAIFDSVQQSLKNYLSEKDSTWKMHERYLVCEGIAKGLHFLHSFNPEIIHGAVTPESILVDTAGKPKLSDLSRAHKLESVSEQSLFGKVFSYLASTNPLQKLVDPDGCNSHSPYSESEYPYLAPEVIQKSPLSKESDIFSLGVVIMEVVSLSPPTPDGPVGDRDEVLRRENDLDRLKRFCLKTESVVRLCLNTKPQGRPALGEVLDVIKKASLSRSLSNESKKSSGNSQMESGYFSGSGSLKHSLSRESHLSRRISAPKDDAVLASIKEDPTTLNEYDYHTISRMRSFSDSHLDKTVLIKKQEFIIPLRNELSDFSNGFLEDTHYTAVPLTRNVSTCGLITTPDDKSSRQSSLSSQLEEGFCFALQRRKLITRRISESLLRRCHILSKIYHKSVCEFLGLFTEQNSLNQQHVVILEELLPVNLHDFILCNEHALFPTGDSNRDFQLITKWSYQLFDGIAYLHSHQLVHGELYGNMVRLECTSLYPSVSNYHIKISYFMQNEKDFPAVRYKSPEYYDKGFKKGEDSASDVWSAACNVVFMVTRRHPWDGTADEDIPSFAQDLVRDKEESVLHKMTNFETLEEVLHAMQLTATLQMFQEVLTKRSTSSVSSCDTSYQKSHYRPQALEVCKTFFHCCKESSEGVRMKLLSRPNFKINMGPSIEQSVSCCDCNLSSTQDEYSIWGDLRKLKKSVAEKGIALTLTVRLALYGNFSHSREDLKSVGPVVCFHSAVSLDEDIALKPPVYGFTCRVIHECEKEQENPSCHFCTLRGVYKETEERYIFEEDYRMNELEDDSFQILIPVKSSTTFRPFCRCSFEHLVCPFYEYNLYLYSNTDSSRIELVVSIKAEVWDEVVKQQYEDWTIVAQSYLPASKTQWEELSLEVTKNLSITGVTKLSQQSVDDIDSSLTRLHYKVIKMEYPPRLVVQSEQNPAGERIKAFCKGREDPVFQHRFPLDPGQVIDEERAPVQHGQIVQALRSIYTNLMEISMVDIINVLYQEKLVTDDVKDKVNAKDTRKEKSAVFLDHFTNTCSLSAIKKFYHILKDSSDSIEIHEEIAEKIEEEFTKYISFSD